ncbi:MAG: tetratricopeptide repeat protein, partial [Proteobacteria bacterium]|nr:tetratricopeptide repeat protein [Pseudomonadota bacterium]
MQVGTAEPSSESLSREGVALVKAGSMAEAVSRFSEALELDPSHVGARFNLAFAYQRMERLEEAESEYRKVLEIRDLTKAHLMLGLLYEKEGKYSNAINEFETVLKKEPGNKVALTGLDDLRIKVTIEEAIDDVIGEAELGQAAWKEAKRIEAERIEAEKIEAERIEAERIEAERIEAERIEAERIEAERIEA